MATVTGLTAERMVEIENASVVSGQVTAGDLILVTRGGTQINAGTVQGPQGTPGTDGAEGPPGPGETVGKISDFPKLPLPAGWLECDGSIRTIVPEEAALAAYLGNQFGGDGTTTYGLPNYKGRIRVSRDPAQVEFDTVGEVGGEKKHLLTASEMPIHAHPDTLAAPPHVHSLSAHVHGSGQGGFITSAFAAGGLATAGSGYLAVANTAGPNTPNSGPASATALSGGVGNAGGGVAHNILQPYAVCVTAIKL